MRKIITVVFILLFTLFQSCGNKQSSNNGKTTPNQTNKTAVAVIKLDSPLNGNSYTTADNIEIKYKTLADSIQVDSTILSINGKKLHTFDGLSYNLPLSNSKMGTQRALLTAYSTGKTIGTLSFVYTVKPLQLPKTYTYKIVNEYPHAMKAYTQGLYYHNDFLYEGTGEYGKSSLRKVDLKTGEVLQYINLDKKYFGEGIALFDNKIYQLTWENRVGFIYNAETFEKIGEFKYATEGWGITTDGKYLIMSDGTANLYFINPSTMNIEKQIEVYSNTGAISSINELEYINGEIWANLFNRSQNDNIVRINPETGEVTGIINLADILKPADRTRDTDVLNGIAYDATNNRIFVTGKNWSKLFEIKIIENK